MNPQLQEMGDIVAYTIPVDPFSLGLAIDQYFYGPTTDPNFLPTLQSTWNNRRKCCTRTCNHRIPRRRRCPCQDPPDCFQHDAIIRDFHDKCFELGTPANPAAYRWHQAVTRVQNDFQIKVWMCQRDEKLMDGKVVTRYFAWLAAPVYLKRKPDQEGEPDDIVHLCTIDPLTKEQDEQYGGPKKRRLLLQTQNALEIAGDDLYPGPVRWDAFVHAADPTPTRVPRLRTFLYRENVKKDMLEGSGW